MPPRIGEDRESKQIPVPKKHFLQWLQTEAYLAELKVWIGFAKFVLALGTITSLTIYVGDKFPEALKYLPSRVAAICSLAGLGDWNR